MERRKKNEKDFQLKFSFEEEMFLKWETDLTMSGIIFKNDCCA